MSQVELAEKLDIKSANISRWKKNDGKPSYEVCEKLIRLGIRVDELFSKEIFEKIKVTHSIDFADDRDEFSNEKCYLIYKKALEFEKKINEK